MAPLLRCREYAILALAGWVGALAAGAVRAETAVLSNGRHVSGKLQIDPQGRWSFQPATGGEPLPLSQLWLLRISETPPEPAHVGPSFRIRFGADQEITGRWKGLDAKACTLYTAWTGEIILPRDALLSLWYDDPAAPPRGPNIFPRRVDPSQDELWLASGDQLFGQVLQVDRDHIDFAARFGKQSYSWDKVRGVFFQKQQAAVQKPDGDTVRLWLWSGFGRSQDLIIGELRGLDDRHLTIRHPLLGERKIERKHVARISWLFP